MDEDASEKRLRSTVWLYSAFYTTDSNFTNRDAANFVKKKKPSSFLFHNNNKYEDSPSFSCHPNEAAEATETSRATDCL